MTCRAVAEYIRDIIVPRYFVVGDEQDHGTGTLLRDFHIGPIQEHQFLSKHFFVIDGRIIVTVDYKRVLANSQYYTGSNDLLKAYPGIKAFSLYQQFKGSSNVVDAILLLTAEILGLP